MQSRYTILKKTGEEMSWQTPQTDDFAFSCAAFNEKFEVIGGTILLKISWTIETTSHPRVSSMIR